MGFVVEVFVFAGLDSLGKVGERVAILSSHTSTTTEKHDDGRGTMYVHQIPLDSQTHCQFHNRAVREFLFSKKKEKRYGVLVCAWNAQA